MNFVLRSREIEIMRVNKVYSKLIVYKRILKVNYVYTEQCGYILVKILQCILMYRNNWLYLSKFRVFWVNRRDYMSTYWL